MRISDWSSDVCSSDLRWQLAPICAQEPTVAQVSTMVPRPTYAPMLTYDGIRIAFGAMNEPLRTAAGGTTRAPCSVNSLALQFANLRGDRKSTRLNSSH